MGRNQTSNEPSGTRLIRLMDTQLLQIIRKEQKNETRICLYGTGKYWTAFEKSAYMLSQLFPASDVIIIKHAKYPFPVVMASISDDELRAFGRQHIFRCDNSDYKGLICSNLPTVKYQVWLRNKMQKFSSEMKINDWNQCSEEIINFSTLDQY